MTVNKEKLTSLLGYCNQALGVLEEYAKRDEKELLSDADRLGNVKYQFIVALEACIDICNHIAARGGMEAPESYGQCFTILGTHRIIDEALAQTMAELGRFRNVLVHRYWNVDDRRVVEVLKTELRTIRTFVQVIARYAA